MHGGHKIIPHTIKRAMQSQCFIDAYCPATVTAQSQGASIDGLGLHGYGPRLADKLLPIVACWQDIRRQTVDFNARVKTGPACQCCSVVPSKRHHCSFDDNNFMMNLMTADYDYYFIIRCDLFLAQAKERGLCSESNLIELI